VRWGSCGTGWWPTREQGRAVHIRFFTHVTNDVGNEPEVFLRAQLPSWARITGMRRARACGAGGVGVLALMQQYYESGWG